MSTTPIEDAMRTKAYSVVSPSRILKLTIYQIVEALKPTTLEVYNDSKMHSHHKAMQGTVSKETHFRLVITSEAFKAKLQPARHRMVYGLLKEELDRAGGIHALQLRTRTLEEEEKQIAREKGEQGQPDAQVQAA